MATRKPTVPKTSAELKAQLEQAKQRLAALEKRAYAEEITELINTTSIVADFAKIQARVKDIDSTAILAAVGAAVGIKRLEVKQTAPVERKSAAANKLKKQSTKAAG